MSKKVTLTLVCLILVSYVVAQKKEAVEDTVNLEELVITGTKIPVSQRETSLPVTVISKEKIERSAGKDLSQVLQNESGLLINGAYGNPGQNKGLYLNGAGTEYTLILIDGQPIFDPSGIGGVVDLRLLPLEQIQKIEILKGSQSTLYGTDAVAGVINLITKKEIEKPINIYGAASYGSLNTLKANLGLKGKLNFFDYDISYFRNSTDGISEAKDTTDSGTFDNDGFFQNGLQTNLGVRLTEKIKLKPYFRFTDFEGDFDADAFTDGDNKYDSRNIQYGSSVEYTDDKFSANINYGYSKTNRMYITSFGPSNFKGRFHNIDVFAQYASNQYLKLLGGVNFQNHKILDEEIPVVDPSIQIFSPYLNLAANYKNLNLEVGYRYNNHDLYGSNSTFSIAPSFFITQNAKVYAGYSTGFKAPTLYQLYGTFGANENLQPLHSKTFEAGLKAENQTGKLSGKLAYFKRKVDDVIYYDFTVGYVNQDEQNDEGIELTADWKINENFSVNGFYNYITGELTTVDDSGEGTKENNLIRRPKNRFSLALQYQLNNLFVSVSGQYLGDRFDYYFNPNNFYAQEEVSLDPYFLVNAYAEYRLLSDQLVLFTDMKNLTDVDFTEVYGYNTIGFNVNLGIRFNLNNL